MGGGGFEPPQALRPPGLQPGAFDHSANRPFKNFIYFFKFLKGF